MSELFKFPIQEKGFGFEGGCGHGKDHVLLCRNNPNSIIISLDLSDGVYVASKRCETNNLYNNVFIKGSLLNIPLKENIIDWAYSFGVFHHTINPQKCIKEISRICRKNSKFIKNFSKQSANKR